MTPADDDPMIGPIDLDELPDLEPGTDGGGEAFDPVMELSQLVNANALAMNELGQDGVQLQDSHTMVTQMINGALLEEILRSLAGEGAVTRVLLTAHQQIADVLSTAKSQVAQAKLMQGTAPVHNGRVTRPGRLT